MRVCSLLSGGKDSNYALYRALSEGAEVSCILVVMPGRSDSWMFHVPNSWVAILQASAMGYGDKVYVLRVSGEKEKEVDELYEGLKVMHEKRGFDTIVVGALASRYQYERISKIAEALGVGVYAPAWLMNQEEYMRVLVESGFKIMVTRVSTMGLPTSLVGKVIDRETLEDILERSRRYGFNPSFEGGEAETLVIDAPHYNSVLRVDGRVDVYSENEAELVVERAWLESKSLQAQQ